MSGEPIYDHDPMLPQVNDSCIYQRADDMIKVKGKVMAIAKTWTHSLRPE